MQLINVSCVAVFKNENKKIGKLSFQLLFLFMLIIGSIHYLIICSVLEIKEKLFFLDNQVNENLEVFT